MRKSRRRASKERWREYERLKRELQARQLPQAEYEAELRALAMRLKV